MALQSGCNPLPSISEAVKVNPSPLQESQVVRKVVPADMNNAQSAVNDGVTKLENLGQKPVFLG